ncbi:MAG TPA: outer membrane lipoprotein carrier protein LolA [Gemmatimonadaceae bacterium]|jgi:outer membrane lipoprotein carrier protein|nr:outer membrane lipoprotein carrier protein LolA [Gemmatimonadaceae bacterium]
MRKLFLASALIAAALPAPRSADAQNAEAIIDRAVAAYGRLNSMRAEFRQTLTNPLTGSTQTTTGVILRKKPNLLSIDFASGDRVAADGSTLWVYLPSSTPGQVMRMPYTGGNATALDPAREFLDSPRARFTVSASGAATVSGRATHAVTLVPKRSNANFTSAKVWIDDADSSIRQFDVENASGLKRHVVITSFTANPAINTSSFRFSVPKGTKVVDQSTAQF